MPKRCKRMYLASLKHRTSSLQTQTRRFTALCCHHSRSHTKLLRGGRSSIEEGLGLTGESKGLHRGKWSKPKLRFKQQQQLFVKETKKCCLSFPRTPFSSLRLSAVPLSTWTL